ncbi:prenyltransferase/squalene oxidase repeat-containing protein [Nocardia sp. CY41]|uniref:prenyltransferase/squalene oxidase repeat-containing protein n=1 Tax=Nocardia sp. CY41 TaxID=2608686 RepID=UPI0013581856|nr:prenyltransferase/squalene oxidase repeat-containing protein [Nocardia sp. CY41]
MDSDVTEMVAAACEFLVSHQDADGHWRDYELPPGRSESWITGCVGVALNVAEDILAPDPRRTMALDRAVAALRDSQRPGGWGYNRTVSCDADTTSWVVRLVATRDPESSMAAALFGSYLTPSGGVRTFPSPVFGSWAAEHDEVAPMAGLALLALGDERTVELIRAHIVSRHRDHGRWYSFWWHSDAYVAAHNLTFLARSGGIPAVIVEAERERLSEGVGPADGSFAAGVESSFDTAQRLITAVRVGASGYVSLLCRALLAVQLPDGGWPASMGLLVPGQRTPTSEIFADDRRLLSTAMAVQALTDAVCETRLGPTTTDKTTTAARTAEPVGSSVSRSPGGRPADG